MALSTRCLSLLSIQFGKTSIDSIFPSADNPLKVSFIEPRKPTALPKESLNIPTLS